MWLFKILYIKGVIIMKKLFLLPLSLLIMLFSACFSEEIDLFADYNLEGTLTNQYLYIDTIFTMEFSGEVLYLFDNIGDNYTEICILTSHTWGGFENRSFSLTRLIGSSIYYEKSSSSYNILSKNLFRNINSFDSKGSFFVAVEDNEGVSIVKIVENPQVFHHTDFLPRHIRPTFIREMNPNSFFNFFAHGDHLIIFEIIGMEDNIIYQVIRLDVDTLTEETIVQQHFSLTENTGNFISNIYVADNNIYVFRTEVYLDGSETTFIDRYNFNGRLINSRLIHMEDFLYMNEVSDIDTVIAIYKVRNYFILETLHSRTAIFREAGNDFVEVKIPETLQLIGSVRPLTNWSADTKYMYFWNFMNHSLYVLDMDNRAFYSITVFVDIEDILFTHQVPIVNQVFRSPRGDLMFKVDSDIRYAELLGDRAINQGFGTSILFPISLEQLEAKINR